MGEYMIALRSLPFLIGATAVGALLSACGGGASSSTVPAQGFSQTSALASHASLSATLVRRDGEIVSPSGPLVTPAKIGDGGGARVFATSAGAEAAYIFAYATGKLLGSFGAGLSEPQGLCTDKKTVWLANTADSTLLQFSKAGKPLGSLTDSGQYPVSCAVDMQGDVAAANIISTNSGPGSVSIWAGGHGSPTNYAVTGMSRVYFLGYDPHGNLFADGSDASGIFALAELVSGASAFVPLTVKGATINFPGGVQFADRALAIGDQSGPSGNGVIYQTHVSGSTATVVGKTFLKGAGDVVQFCITRYKTVIAPTSQGLEVFPYPAGGGPIRSFGAGQPQALEDCAIVY
jgi:hypothetical protein